MTRTMMEGQSRLLQWASHQGSILSVFNDLLSTESHVDVTIASEGRYLRAHKIILSACSSYFQELLNVDVNKHPIFILKDVKYSELEALIHFMYRGEVRVPHEDLPSLLKVAQSLKIRGLASETESGETPNFGSIPPDRIVDPWPLPPTTIPNDNSIGQSSVAGAEGISNREGGEVGRISSQAESGEEIPLLFYNELLLNSEMHELLAGKITECLDSPGGGDAVVKAVSSMAEKDIVDAFFKDFFEIELGGIDMAVEPVTTATTPTPGALGPELGEKESQEEPSTKILIPNVTEPGTSYHGQLDRPNVIVEPIPGTILSHPSSPSSHLTSPKPKIQNKKTVITVVADEYRDKNELPPSASTPSRRKSRNIRKPRLLARPSNENSPGVSIPEPIPSRLDNARLDIWSRLGRRSINPKVSDDSQGTIQVHDDCDTEEQPYPLSPMRDEVVVISDSPFLPPPSPVGSDVVVFAEERFPSLPNSSCSPSPSQTVYMDVIIPLDSPLLRKSPEGQVLRTVETNVNIEDSGKLRESPISTVKEPTGGKRRFLAMSLSQKAVNLVENQFQSPFPTVEQPSAQSNPHFIERKSYSTPRKRNRHVRNLQFKTPPSLRVESPGDLEHDNFFSQRNGERETPRKMKSTKKLEWTVASSSPLPKIPEQDEEGSFTTGGLEEDAVPSLRDGPSVTLGWVPPPTPRMLSPQQCNFAWQSPVSFQKVSPDHNYGLTLGRLFGSPLGPGCTPRTPGRIWTRPPSLFGSEGKLVLPPPLSTSQQFRRSPIFLPPEGVDSEKPREATVSVIVEPLKRDEHEFLIPSKPRRESEDSDSWIPPKKRRRLTQKTHGQSVSNQTENPLDSDAKSPPFHSVGNTRVLRPRLNLVPETRHTFINSPGPGSPKLVVPTPPPLSPGIKRRVLALQKRSITFPERGFQFRRVLDRHPKISFKVNGRQKFISVSGKTTILSLRNSPALSAVVVTSPSKPSTSNEPNLTQLLNRGTGQEGTCSQNQEMRTYNKRGQLVTMKQPSKYTFEDHFHLLLGRLPPSPNNTPPL